jgi:hypothetical protein
VQIVFSRHARGRADLYGIVEATIMMLLADLELGDGKHEITRAVESSRYPLKIVVVVKSDIMTVVTNYPVKEGRRS